MKGYVKAAVARSEVVSEDGWYLKLGDVGYYFIDPEDGGADLYWCVVHDGDVYVMMELLLCVCMCMCIHIIRHRYLLIISHS